VGCEARKIPAGGDVFFLDFSLYSILEIDLGVSNLFVPADNFVFAAPSLILHYIHGHGYDPPSSFWDAVMASSRLSFEDYKEALIRNGLLEALKLKRKRPR
jgi:hypothetical protein